MPWADPWSRAGATYRPRGVVPPGAGGGPRSALPRGYDHAGILVLPRRQGVNGAVSHKEKGVATFWLNRHRSRERAKGGEYEFLPPAPKYRSVKAAFARRPQAVARV